MKLKFVVASISLFFYFVCLQSFASSHKPTHAKKTKPAYSVKNTKHTHAVNKHPAQHTHAVKKKHPAQQTKHIHAVKKKHPVRKTKHTHAVKKPVIGEPRKKIFFTYHPLCLTNADLRTLDEMTQNIGRALPNPCNPIWSTPFALSAGFNIDGGKWGNQSANIMGVNYQSVAVNDAYLSLLAIANFWTRGFASVDIGNPTIHTNPSSRGRFGSAEYSAAYANNIDSNNRTMLQLEQAFLTLGDVTVFPFFIQVGKGFQDFGRYTIHPITRSFTQVMSESLGWSGKIGVIANGFHGSLFVLENPIPKFNHAPSNRGNYGFGVGFDQPECRGFRWNLGGSYLNNLIAVNDIAYNVINYTRSGHYHKRVNGVALYADIYDGPFSLLARYTTAIQRFDAFDLPRHGVADFTNRNINGTLLPHKKGAKPWTVAFEAAYHFNALGCRHQKIYLGLQTSRQGAPLNLPHYRYLAGYNIDAWQAINLGVEWDQDRAFSVDLGGTNKHSHLVSLRAAVSLS